MPQEIQVDLPIIWKSGATKSAIVTIEVRGGSAVIQFDERALAEIEDSLRCPEAEWDDLLKAISAAAMMTAFEIAATKLGRPQKELGLWQKDGTGTCFTIGPRRNPAHVELL